MHVHVQHSIHTRSPRCFGVTCGARMMRQHASAQANVRVRHYMEYARVHITGHAHFNCTFTCTFTCTCYDPLVSCAATERSQMHRKQGARLHHGALSPLAHLLLFVRGVSVFVLYRGARGIVRGGEHGDGETGDMGTDGCERRTHMHPRVAPTLLPLCAAHPSLKAR